MIYPKIKQSKVQEKEISAFYGVCRTPKVNDFQLSDMENMDCSSFPFVSTRKSRVRFPDADFPAMKLICSDSDIYDDYAVTGIAEDGRFFYRGQEVPVEDETDEEWVAGDSFAKADFLTEFMGDYVLLPNMEAVSVASSVTNDGVSVFGKRRSFAGGGAGLESSFTYTDNYGFYENGILSVGRDGSVFFEVTGRPWANAGSYPSTCETLYKALASGQFYAGRAYRLTLTCGYKNNEMEYIYSGVCPIPEDVFIVIDSVHIWDSGMKTEYAITENSFDRDKSDIFDGKSTSRYLVEVRANAYNLSGEKVNLEPYFYESAIGSTVDADGIRHFNPTLSGSFRAGVVQLMGADYGYQMYVNDFALQFINAPYLMAAPYGGRLFFSDVFGVEIVYTGADGKQYQIAPTGTPAGGGAVLCKDPGKWTAMQAYNNALYVFKRDAMYRIYSSDGLSFYMERLADVGALSSDCVCVVDNIMYFLSAEGLYSFGGAYPEKLPDVLGRTYAGGCLGGADGVLYCSLGYKADGALSHELCVYHIDKGIFSVHDDFCARGFVRYGGALYALSDSGDVYLMDACNDAVSFSLSTKEYFFSFQKKGVNGVRLYFDFDPVDDSGFVEISVSKDGGPFEKAAGRIVNGRVKYVPVKFSKCDVFCIRVSGKGIFTLKSISFSLYHGGDVKQN